MDAELLMKVLGNPDMAALLTSLAKSMKVLFRKNKLVEVTDTLKNKNGIV